MSVASSAVRAFTRPSKDRNQKLVGYLSQPLILEEAGPPAALLHLLTLCSVFVIGFIVWAIITPMQETAATHGQIIPAGSVHVVQHLEGGIVAEIMVDDGQVVEAGQPLIRLESAAAQAELDQLKARESALAIKAERLRAFVLGFQPDFSVGRAYPDLVDDEQTILQIQKEARDTQRSVLITRIEQRRAEIGSLEGQRKNLQGQIAIINEQVEMHRDLEARGMVSRMELLDNERTLIEVVGQLNTVIADIKTAQEALNEAQGAIFELEASLGSDAVSEMGEIGAELAQVRETLLKMEDRARRLEIKAPVRGVIKGMTTKTIGSVVPSAETIMEIVPINDVMVAEVRIEPKDVGHLVVGQSAQVKVTTYDVARFGTVEGHLAQISASTFMDEREEPYYKGIVALSRSYVGENPDMNPILPGMVVDADVSTGSKSLLRYLLKPVFRSLDGAFTER